MAGLAMLGALITLALPPAVVAEPGVRDRVLSRGHVICGVDHSPGFSGFDEMGHPHGFEIDFCRSLAAALLGNAERFRTRRVNTSTKFQALVASEIDVALGMSTWTFARDTSLGVRFVTPIFFDGQGFVGWRDNPITQSANLKGARVCVQDGTTSADNLRDYNLQHQLDLEIILSSSSDDRTNRFVRRECDLMTGDRSELAARLVASTLDTARWQMLDPVISREPLGPYVLAQDADWQILVRWVALIPQIADVREVNSSNLAQITNSADTELLRLAGLDSEFGQALGLDPEWARRIIEQVGSYSEIFARHLGAESPFNFPQGPNQPVEKGGWFFPPPLR